MVELLVGELRELTALYAGQMTGARGTRLKIGLKLLKLRELCQHGTWLAYLEQLGLHQRTAQRAIDDARVHLGQIPPKSERKRQKRQSVVFGTDGPVGNGTNGTHATDGVVGGSGEIPAPDGLDPDEPIADDDDDDDDVDEPAADPVPPPPASSLPGQGEDSVYIPLKAPAFGVAASVDGMTVSVTRGDPDAGVAGGATPCIGGSAPRRRQVVRNYVGQLTMAALYEAADMAKSAVAQIVSVWGRIDDKRRQVLARLMGEFYDDVQDELADEETPTPQNGATSEGSLRVGGTQDPAGVLTDAPVAGTSPAA